MNQMFYRHISTILVVLQVHKLPAQQCDCTVAVPLRQYVEHPLRLFTSDTEQCVELLK